MAGPEYTESMGGTWYEGSVLSVAIGQESSQFTPIQLASYISTLVNGGTRKSTHLLKEIKSSDYSQIVETYEPEAVSYTHLDVYKRQLLDTLGRYRHMLQSESLRYKLAVELDGLWTGERPRPFGRSVVPVSYTHLFFTAFTAPLYSPISHTEPGTPPCRSGGCGPDPPGR